MVPAPVLRQRSINNTNQMAREIVQFENLINSNNFNAMDLHHATKKNSLYFMLQYVYQKFEFGEQLRIDAKKY